MIFFLLFFSFFFFVLLLPFWLYLVLDWNVLLNICMKFSEVGPN